MKTTTINPQILNALIWAGIILASSWVMESNDIAITNNASSSLLGFYIAGWMMTSNLLRRRSGEANCCNMD